MEVPKTSSARLLILRNETESCNGGEAISGAHPSSFFAMAYVPTWHFMLRASANDCATIASGQDAP
jgi:hypothetical protein